MRAPAALALLALTAAAPAPPSIDTLARDTEAHWVPFDLTNTNQIRFAMRVDGRPVRAILDTGVSYSALSRRYADAVRMHVRPGAGAITVGGSVASGWTDAGSIELGGLTRSRGRIAVAELPLAATGGGPVDLLVGRDLTGGYALDIDYDARRFRLLPSGRMPFRGTASPLAISGGWPVYVGEIAIGARRIGRMAIDTGDGNAVTLSHAAWEALDTRALPVTSTISYGIGGATVTGLAVVSAVRIGPSVARDVEVAIEPEGGFSQRIGLSGRIGSGFLRRYRVLLDPTAGRMVLSPGATAYAAPVRSTSGLLVRRDGDRLTVVHVMRGGPGAATGWRAGEQICAVNGTPVGSDAALVWPVGTPGRSVALGLCGGATRTMTLRRFY